MNIHDLSISQLNRAAAIKERIDALNKEVRDTLGEPAESRAVP
jgi:hypothetical protein